MTKREEKVLEIIENMNGDDFMWALDTIKDNFFYDEEIEEEVKTFLEDNGITLEEFKNLMINK